MLSGTMAFLLGVVSLYQLERSPDLWLTLLFWLLPLPLLALCRLRRPMVLWLLFGAGLNWALLDAQQRLHPSLSSELEGVPLQVVGVVDSLPQPEGRVLRFAFAVEQARQLDGRPVQLPARLRLAWYNDYPAAFRPGQRWQLRLKLKRPHGYRNPGGFDYERWLFQQGIRATGYVLKQGDNRLLREDAGGYPLMRSRHALQQAIAQQLPGHSMRGIITALAIGERSGISDEQWQVLMATGTNHLVAISGLHVGLVAALCFWLVRWGWSFCPACCLRLAAPRAASLLAIAGATGYAALAGFSIPTQRALIMAVVVLGALFLLRPFSRMRLLILALWGVLLLDPISVLAPGFWLSFGAVAWIFYGMSGRLRTDSLWWRWGRVQFLLALGLLPLLLLFFQQGSLSSPLANLVAVPWVSLLVVPLTLTGVLLLPWWPSAGGLLLELAATLMQWLWPLLQWLEAALPLLPRAVSLWSAACATAGLLWLFAPHGWPLRHAGVVLLLPVLFPRGEPPAEGTALFTLLDVGQGLSAVVQTRNHVLVFDTGPRYPSGFDTGAAVVVPFLREQGISQIDTLVISHDGNDHAGGTASLLSRFPVTRLLGNPGRDSPGASRAEGCARGESWQWDGVSFNILHPAEARASGSSNDTSCVLRVTAGPDSLLLTADIEAPAERELLASGEPLGSTILVAPHHGSKTSSTAGFVARVDPQLVLFSVGYRNRYGFPHPSVVARYRQRGVEMLRTDETGALQLELGRGRMDPSGWRRLERKIWHQ